MIVVPICITVMEKIDLVLKCRGCDREKGVTEMIVVDK